MVKQKISVTVDEKMIKIIGNLLADAKFRNRSHVVEVALNEMIGGEK